MARRHGRTTCLFVLAGLLVLALAAPANAATTSKPYWLTIAAGVPSYETTAAAPDEVASGETVGITATFKNETTTQQIGSANLVAPSGVTVLSASVSPSGSASLATYCSVNGATVPSCVALRNLSVAPGASATVTMSVATRKCAQGNFAWSAEVKQANNYNGAPGNDFFYDASGSHPSTTLDGACSLTFSQEPADAQTGQAISGQSYTPEPTGPAVAVQVRDINNNLVTTSAIPVTMSTGTNPVGATLVGNETPSTVAGTATFSDLALNLPSVGCDTVLAPASCYTLVATPGPAATALSPVTSTPFDIQDQAASCILNASCTTTASPSGVNSSTIVANASSGTGELVESAILGNYGQQTLSLCGSSYTSADPYVYESAYTPVPGTADRGEVDTITFAPATKLSGSAWQVLSTQQICFGDAKPFTTPSGPAAQITLPNGQTLYVGLLPTCQSDPDNRDDPDGDADDATGPCHSRQQDSTIPDSNSPTGYDIRLVADVPVGWADDPYRM